MHGKIITALSPKTAGVTTVSLNMAMAYQSQFSQEKVLFIQIDQSRDLHFFCGEDSFQNSWGDLALSGIFNQKTSPDHTPTKTALSQCLEHYAQIEILASPNGEEFPDKYFSEHIFWENILSFLRTQYHLIMIDISRNISTSLQRQIQNISDQILLITHFCPHHLQAISPYVSPPNTHKNKTVILLNQAIKSMAKEWQKQETSIKNIGYLSMVEGDAYRQYYRGMPIVSQRFSPWRKEIKKILENLFPQKF